MTREEGSLTEESSVPDGQDFPEKGSKRESGLEITAGSRVNSALGGDRSRVENGKVAPPRRVANRARRTREHLTPDEVTRLMAAAGRGGRHPHRDATLILLGYRHGLRVSELVALRWDQIDLRQGLVHVSR